MNSKRPITAQQALNRAAALCAAGERAPGDILDKVVKWGLPRAEAQQVVDKLIEQGFLDEGRFARAFVHDKFTFNGWGRIKIGYMLRQKHVGNNAIADALATIDDEAYRQRLLDALRTKARDLKDRGHWAARAALMRHGASRGYEQDLLQQCITQVLGNDDGDFQDD